MTDLTTLVSYYEDSASYTYDARKKAERDRDYYDNKQLTSEEIATLRGRGQPDVISNRIKPKIDSLLGLERQMRTDPKALPRAPDDEDAAHAATDGLRYVAESNQFDLIRSDAMQELSIEGTCGAIVEVDEKRKVKINRISWDRIFYDPHSRSRTFADAKFKGIVVWLDEDEAIRRYGDSAKGVFATGFSDAMDADSTYRDKPYMMWFDTQRKRGKVCEIYWQEASQWMYACYTKSGFLKEPAPSSYVDEDGVPICPIELTSCHIDRDNNRYGVVRQLIGIQDEINKRRSKALHAINTRQIHMERGAVDNVQAMKKELGKPDGVVETTPGMEWEIIPTNDVSAGNLALLQEAKGEIDAVGANAALTGKQEGTQSGRALIQRQQAGVVELGPLFDSLKMWSHAIYRQVWYRIKQYWDAEMWVRVTDDENNLKFIGLNQPTTMGEQQIEKMKKAGASQEEMQQAVQQLASDPMAQQPAMNNDVSQMTMDIIVEDAPNVANIQEEQFALLIELAKLNPQAIPPHLVIEASSLRNKDRILEEIKPKPQQQAQQGQVQQQAAELAMAEQQAKVAKLQSETAKNEADVQQTKLETMLATMAAQVAQIAAGLQRLEPPQSTMQQPVPQAMQIS